jgi:putative aldouronate transport system permease protein
MQNSKQVLEFNKSSVESKKDRRIKKRKTRLELANVHTLYFFLLPALIITFLFGYIPMFSNIIAFMDYDMMNPWFGFKSPFVGFRNFSFLRELWFYKLTIRTVTYSFAGLIFGFPASLILALLFNELRSHNYKKVIQTISYIPHFVSWVTVSGLVYMFLTVEPEGIINTIRITLFGGERISYMQDPKYFLPLLVITGVWKGVGWGTILYMASLSTIDEQIYEAAEVDGASRWKKVCHITIPGLIPTFCILLIFALGGLFSTNFDQIFNLQNAVIRADVMTINLYTYFNGIVNQQYSLTTAVGLFQGVVSFMLIASTNYVTRKLSDTGIF